MESDQEISLDARNEKIDIDSQVPPLNSEIKREDEELHDDYVLIVKLEPDEQRNESGDYFQNGFLSSCEKDENNNNASPSAIADPQIDVFTKEVTSTHPRNSLNLNACESSSDIYREKQKLNSVQQTNRDFFEGYESNPSNDETQAITFMENETLSYNICGINCNRCGKYFSLVRELREHKKSCRGDKPCKCEICGKTFTLNANLKTHQRIHTGEKHYKCDICGEQFIYNYHLKNHKSIHTGENPYCCNLCGKQFSQSSNLKKHLITHTGEKHYKCGLCGKQFSQSSNLKKHLIIHTGEKPHRCDNCGKEFAYNCNLKVHRISCIASKLFGCDVCGKKYFSRTKLNSHQLTHVGKKIV